MLCHAPLKANKMANTRAANNEYLPPYKINPMQAAKTGLFYSRLYPLLAIKGKLPIPRFP